MEKSRETARAVIIAGDLYRRIRKAPFNAPHGSSSFYIYHIRVPSFITRVPFIKIAIPP